jgi:hypothetical protein
MVAADPDEEEDDLEDEDEEGEEEGEGEDEDNEDEGTESDLKPSDDPPIPEAAGTTPPVPEMETA